MPTHKEIVDAAVNAGYGEELPNDYNDSSPVIVAGGIMPKWMADIYGYIGRKERKDDLSMPERVQE